MILVFFWRPGISFIFAFMLLWQWLQVSIKIFYADILNIDVSGLSQTGSSQEAILLSLAGLFILGAGIYIMISDQTQLTISELKEEAKKYSLKRLFLIYLTLTVINLLIQVILFEYPSITQMLVGLMNIKVLIILIVFFVSLLLDTSKKYLLIIVAIEIVNGFIGYFSSFKTILFFLIIIAFSINYKIKPSLFLRYAIVVSVIAFLGIFWTSVREDYRSILNQGTGMQEVLISPAERLKSLTSLAENLSTRDLKSALELAIYRISYTDIFGQVLDRVPAYTTYENGKILTTTIKHIFTPRFIFPNKKILDDSEMTNFYTAKNYFGSLKGTSVGMGYMAEFYIDFGYYFMFIPIFLMGCFYGYIYNFFVKNSKSKVIHLSISAAILFNAYLFETTQAKLIGGLLSAFIIMILLNKLLLKYLIKIISK